MAHGISVPSGGRAVPRGPKRLLSLRGDDGLVDRVRAGDETAFEVIYERHVPGVLSFCRHMLGSREEAEDAVQHAFTAAHGALLRDGREINLKPWLYAIARNRCLSVLRARREQHGEEIETGTEGLHAEVERRAELRQLVEDLQDLPDEQRAALVLSELRDLSHREVAEVLGCRVANVKGLVFRARAGLSERREAREAACETIQEELATAQGGTLRRGRLRHHLRSCAPCSAYLEDVRRQRKMMAAILPVVPTVGLKSSVFAAVGAGGAAGVGGGAAAGGGLLTAITSAGGATVAKVALIGAVVAGGGGLVGQAALEHKSSAPGPTPAAAPQAPFGAPADPKPGRVGDVGAAKRERSVAGPPVALKDELSRRRQRAKASKAKRERALARGRSKHPSAPGRGRRKGAGKPVEKLLRVVPPRPVKVPRRLRPRHDAPVAKIKPEKRVRTSPEPAPAEAPTPGLDPATPDG